MASNFAFTNQTAIATDVAMNDLAPVAKNICSEFIGNETFHADARIESNIIDDTLLYTQITFTSIIMMTSNEIGDDVRDTFNRTLTVSGNPDAAITE